MTISTNGAFARPFETVALPEYEAAFVAARRLDDERVTGGPRGALEMFEVSDDVSFWNSGLSRELVGRQRTALQRVAKRLAGRFVTGWNVSTHGKWLGRSPVLEDMFGLGRTDHDLPLRSQATRQTGEAGAGLLKTRNGRGAARTTECGPEQRVFSSVGGAPPPPPAT